MHRWAVLASVPIGVVLVALADGTRTRLVVAVFSIGSTIMLGASALVHLKDWSVEQVELMVRLDHSAIFIMFATSSTPVALLVLDAPQSGWMLGIAWVGALIGIGAEWTPVHPPAGVMNAAYLVLGWSMLAFIPWMIRALSMPQIVLLLAGGAAYTVGAIVVGARWPDPWSSTFGYHEIWHVFVVVAVACHTVLVASLAW